MPGLKRSTAEQLPDLAAARIARGLDRQLGDYALSVSLDAMHLQRARHLRWVPFTVTTA